MQTADATPPIRVLIHGLSYFSRMLPTILKCDGWDLRNFSERYSAELVSMAGYLARCDLVYTWSGRITTGKFLAVARLLGKKKIVMFWCGSDVLEGLEDYAAGKMEPWLASKIHWAGAPWLADEIRSIGLPCEYVPSTWVQSIPYLPKLPKKFTVLAYLPDAKRTELYGIDKIIAVARALPAIEFKIVGLCPGQTLCVPENVTLHAWVQDMALFYRESTVLWRPTRHDGLSFTALEALAHGRYVIWSYPFTGAHHARDAGAARIEIERLYEQHQKGRLGLNRVGADYVATNFSRSRIREGILTRWRAIVAPELQLTPIPHLGVEAQKPLASAPRSTNATRWS